MLRIYRQRLGLLDARLALGQPEVLPLGLLMIVPREHPGADQALG